MRRLQLWLGVLAAVAVAMARPARAEEEEGRSLRVVNDTASALTALYIAAPGRGEPVEVLDGAMITPSASAEVSLAVSDCRVVFRAVFLNKSEIVRPDLDICAGPDVRLGALLAEDAAPEALQVRTPSPPPPPRGSPFQVVVSPDEAGDAPTPEPSNAAAAPPLERGVPICPGDARCRKKPGG